jgi:hypothetical protein
MPVAGQPQTAFAFTSIVWIYTERARLMQNIRRGANKTMCQILTTAMRTEVDQFLDSVHFTP